MVICQRSSKGDVNAIDEKESLLLGLCSVHGCICQIVVRRSGFREAHSVFATIPLSGIRSCTDRK